MTQKLSLDSQPVTNPNVVLRLEQDDCGLLFDLDANQVRVLNRSAVAIWQLIDGRRSLREVLACLAESFDDVGPEAQDQLLRTVADLRSMGALELAEP